MLDILSEKIKVYESCLLNIQTTQEALKENNLYKALQELSKESAQLESEIKDMIKKDDIPEIKGNKKQFVLQNRISKIRSYDFEKIKTNERLSKQVLVETVDNKVFELLQKGNQIENAEQYYTENEKIVKAVLITDIKE